MKIELLQYMGYRYYGREWNTGIRAVNLRKEFLSMTSDLNRSLAANMLCRSCKQNISANTQQSLIVRLEHDEGYGSIWICFLLIKTYHG
jgi:hypothetical protein